MDSSYLFFNLKIAMQNRYLSHICFEWNDHQTSIMVSFKVLLPFQCQPPVCKKFILNGLRFGVHFKLVVPSNRCGQDRGSLTKCSEINIPFVLEAIGLVSSGISLHPRTEPLWEVVYIITTV